MEDALTDQPTARSERTPLNRERVLQAALELADESGLDALTMRELGRRLGVEAMSLYNHVSNKDDVLDGVLDLVAAEMDLPGDELDWKLAMRRRAVSARRVFSAHPWAVGLMDSRESSGPARMHYFDWVIGTLRRAGFTIELALHGFSTIDSYVYGFGRQSLSIPAGEDEQAMSAEAFLSAIPSDEFPYLTEVVVEQMLKVGWDEDADFEFGLGLILDGLERARDSAAG